MLLPRPLFQSPAMSASVISSPARPLTAPAAPTQEYVGDVLHGVEHHAIIAHGNNRNKTLARFQNIEARVRSAIEAGSVSALRTRASMFWKRARVLFLLLP